MKFDETRFYTVATYLALVGVYDMPMEKAEKIRREATELSHSHKIEIQEKVGRGIHHGMRIPKFRGSILHDVCVKNNIKIRS